jgi:predicted nucleotidyltransferase
MKNSANKEPNHKCKVMNEQIENIKKTIYDLSVKNRAIFALLFGSYARGTATKHSDLDVIFVEKLVNLSFQG